MADHGASRFTPQSKSTHERLSTHTVGLVALSDFRKRRAEVLEQQEREAREAAISGTPTPTPASDRSSTGTPDNAGSQPGARPLTKKRRRTKTKTGKKKLLLSFGDDDEEEEDDEEQEADGETDGGDPPPGKPRSEDADTADEGDAGKPKFRANASVGIVPRAVTKAALLKEATEREALRREFVAVQEAVKATEVALPFVFYDGTNIPGGTVRIKKGDFVWVFLDKSRKVGAELGVGEKRNTRRGWARVGVDDLMLHYDFYFFIINRSHGPGGHRLFAYSAAATLKEGFEKDGPNPPGSGQLSTAASRAAAARNLVDIDTLEGAADEPTRTKVVDRRWYERNKHIYPASTWHEFDPEKDYATEVRKDNGGNTYFFPK
ncbi:hypothetical protein EsDP_00001414 [Epichloe bromicola]|uniref:FAM50A/XAP5 C-terminal domain-containing protein n=1 Tax=Epichloe bromicola TaxID=79588 RepID=A0ABQ0CHS7_9HYPO